MRVSLTVSGTLRRAKVREAISSRDGFGTDSDCEGGEADTVGRDDFVSLFNVDVATSCSGCGEEDREDRGFDVMTVVDWRFAGLLVDKETLRRRDLNFVRFSCNAAVASSWYQISVTFVSEEEQYYLLGKNNKCNALALACHILGNPNSLHCAVL